MPDNTGLPLEIVQPIPNGTETLRDQLWAALQVINTYVALLALDAEVVHDTGDETVAGIKTFSASPLVPTLSAGDTSTKAANAAFVAAAVAAAVTGLLDLKTGTDCSTNPNYPAASKGDAYFVTVAGKIGGASGKSVDVGDVYFADADNAGGTEASVGTSWIVLEHNLAGALLAANNLSDLNNVATALTNLTLQAGTTFIDAIVKRLRVTGPVDLLLGAVADGEYLKRNGTAIIGGTPAGGASGAMTQIAQTVVTGSAAANISFTSIPATYNSLLLMISGRSTDAGGYEVYCRFNGDTAGNYDRQFTLSNGTGGSDSDALAATSAWVSRVAVSGSTAGANGGGHVWIPNYRRTTFHKFCTAQCGLRTGTSAGNLYLSSMWNTWRNTAAITQIDLFCSLGSWDIGSVVTLYGVN